MVSLVLVHIAKKLVVPRVFFPDPGFCHMLAESRMDRPPATGYNFRSTGTHSNGRNGVVT